MVGQKADLKVGPTVDHLTAQMDRLKVRLTVALMAGQKEVKMVAQMVELKVAL